MLLEDIYQIYKLPTINQRDSTQRATPPPSAPPQPGKFHLALHLAMERFCLVVEPYPSERYDFVSWKYYFQCITCIYIYIHNLNIYIYSCVCVCMWVCSVYIYLYIYIYICGKTKQNMSQTTTQMFYKVEYAAAFTSMFFWRFSFGGVVRAEFSTNRIPTNSPTRQR